MKVLSPLVAVLVTLLHVGSGPAQTNMSEEAFGIVMAEHRQARELVQTMSCKIKFTLTQPKVGDSQTRVIVSTGEYFHARDAVRLKAVDNNGDTLEFVWKDSVRHTLQSRRADGRTEYAATLSGYSSRYMHRCDAWARALLVLSLPGTSTFVTLDDFVSASERVERKWTTTKGGHTLTTIRLKFSGGKRRVDVILDSQINNLIRKVIYYEGSSPEQNEGRREDEVTQCSEVKRGVLFPTEIVGRSGVGEVLNMDLKLSTITDIKVDRVMPDGIFVMKYPHGIYMTDSLTGTSYRIDQNGKPISKPDTLGEHPPAPPADKSRIDSVQQTESQDEENSYTSIYVVCVSVLLVIVAVALLVRNRRKRLGDYDE